MHCTSYPEEEKWIQDHVERETSWARKRVDNTEALVQQEQEDVKNVEQVGFKNSEPNKTFEEMIVAIGDSVSDLASSENGDDEEDKDDVENQQGVVSKDDDPGWAMGTITRMIKQYMERFRHM